MAGMTIRPPIPCARPMAGLLLAAALTGGCAAADGGNQRVAASGSALVPMARLLGTRQCESGGPTPESVANTLRDASIGMTTFDCGHDGRMRPAVCGAPDGRLVVVDVPVAQQERAEALGWRPLASMPGAQRQACR